MSRKDQFMLILSSKIEEISSFVYHFYSKNGYVSMQWEVGNVLLKYIKKKKEMFL